jgi:CRISPR-associated protein Cas2
MVDAAQLVTVKSKLIKLIDEKTDSLRFYALGNNYKTKVEHYGAKPSFDVTEPLIL